MNYLIALAVCFFLISCNKSEDGSQKAKVIPSATDDTNKEENKKPDSSENRKNTTNYGVCGELDGVRSELAGRWEMSESQGNNNFYKITLEIRPGQITLRQDCYMNGHRLTPETTVAAYYAEGILNVLGDGSDTRKAQSGTTNYECRTQLIKNDSSYKFVGNCLQLNGFQGRNHLLFIPQ